MACDNKKDSTSLMWGIIIAIAAIIISIVLFMANEEISQSVNTPLVIDYYYSPTCSYCVQQDAVFDNLTFKYGDEIMIIKHDITTDPELLATIMKNYNGHGYVPFMVFNDNTTLEGYYEENYAIIEYKILNRNH